MKRENIEEQVEFEKMVASYLEWHMQHTHDKCEAPQDFEISGWIRNNVRPLITKAKEKEREKCLAEVLKQLHNHGISAPSMEALVVDRNLFVQILEEALKNKPLP